MRNKSGRTFTASLKPAWTIEQIEEFSNSMVGSAIVYIINHGKDLNENNELVEPHTHILLEYETPRKVSTVANLLKVEPNFIVVVRNKAAMLRYLTHLGSPDKHQYDFEEVYTNNTITYEMAVVGSSMSDKEIAEYILRGRGMDLIGVVPIGKLRTIQGFIHFDQSNSMVKELKRVNDRLDSVLDIVENVQSITNEVLKGLGDGIKYSVETLTGALVSVSNELSRSNNMIENRKFRARK